MEAKEESEKEKGMRMELRTRGLFMEILTKMGCQYELAEEEGDNRIFFAYQGEHFFVDARDDGNIFKCGTRIGDI